MAVINSRTDLYLMRADGSHLTRMTNDGLAKGSLAWHTSSGPIVYSLRDREGWRLMKIDIISRSNSEISGTDGVVVLQRIHNTVYARRIGDTRLMTLDTANEKMAPLTPHIHVQDLEAWAPSLSSVYKIRGAGGANAALTFTSWDGAERNVAAIKPGSRPGLTVSPDRHVIVPQLIHDGSDLNLIEVSNTK